MSKIAFIGLGVMGFPMAGHLAQAGHNVTAYNRSPMKALKWSESYAGRIAKTPQEAAEACDYVMLCVGNDADVEAVVAGNQGIIHSIKPGAIVVDHTTTSADIARKMAKLLASHQAGFIDAPVSGGQIGAEKGTLTIMAGGDKKYFDLVEPILAAYSKKREWFGDSGNGQISKMVNQILIAGVIQSLAEGLQFASKAGLDIEKLIETLRQGAAQSWQLEHRGRTMAEDKFDFGFAVDWMLKDLGFAEAESEKLGTALPITKIIRKFYQELSDSGFGRLDTSSLIKRLY